MLAQPQQNLNALARQMADRLQLSAATAQALQESFTRYADRYEQGGFLWYVAAELQRRLNDEQLAEFWPKPPMRNYPERRMHPGRLDQAEPPRRRAPLNPPDPRIRRARPHPEGMWPPAHQAILHWADYLNLTEAQRDSLAVLERRKHDALHELRQQEREGILTHLAFREQERQLRKQYYDRFLQLLTPEQQQRLARLEARSEESRKAMLDVLRLTTEQQQQLAAQALHPKPARLAWSEILNPQQEAIVHLYHQLFRVWQTL